jgi:hypothetical protein
MVDRNAQPSGFPNQLSTIDYQLFMTQQVLIEQIVAEVMRRLIPTASSAPVSSATNNGHEVVLADLVITADLLAEKSAGRKQIAVTSKANGGWKRKSVESVDEAAKKAIGELRRESSRVIVVLTSEPEVAACLANRNEKVRAAVVADAAAVARVKSGLDGNVFVVDPTGRSFFEMRNLLRRIVEK